MAKKTEIQNQFENMIQQTAQKNKEKAEQKAIEKQNKNIEKPIEQYIEQYIENSIENTIENTNTKVDIEGENSILNKIEFEANLDKNISNEKQVKSYYFKKATIKNIKKYAKMYNMKDSVFIETILEQFFAAVGSKKSGGKK